MAKGMYATVGGVTKKIKKQYCVVGGVTKKIKKVYAVVGGVTRLVWNGGGELSYYGQITAMNSQKVFNECVSTKVGNYLVIAGSSQYSSNALEVETYNTSLTKGTATSLPSNRSHMAAASVGNYAIFYNGDAGTVDGTTYSGGYTYNTSLTRGGINQIGGGSPLTMMAGCSFGNYALLGGGQAYVSYISQTVKSNQVYSVNASLTGSTLTGMSYERTNFYIKPLSNYALVIGYTNTVEYYDTSLTRSSLSTKLPWAPAMSWAPCASLENNYVIVIEGNKYGACINTSLTQSIPTLLSSNRREMQATSVGDFVIIPGGEISATSSIEKTVEKYDKSLTKTAATDLNVGRSNAIVDTIGNYALVIGGMIVRYSTATTATEAYTAG